MSQHTFEELLTIGEWADITGWELWHFAFKRDMFSELWSRLMKYSRSFASGMVSVDEGVFVMDPLQPTIFEVILGGSLIAAFILSGLLVVSASRGRCTWLGAAVFSVLAFVMPLVGHVAAIGYFRTSRRVRTVKGEVC